MKFSVSDSEILAISITHYTTNLCRFNIFNNWSKINITTDLGYITGSVLESLEKNNNYNKKKKQKSYLIFRYSNKIYKPLMLYNHHITTIDEDKSLNF